MISRLGILAAFLSLIACRDEPVAETPAAEMVWAIEAGEEWLYDVTASYAGGTSPKLWSSDEVLSEQDGRIILNFQRLRSYRGREEIKEGKGKWDVFYDSRGGRLEEEIYLSITADKVAFWGGKIAGDSPKPVMSLSVPLDLYRSGAKGGDRWQFQLGKGNTRENRRTFRVTGLDRVQVPAGEFEAIRVIAEGSSRGLEAKETYWFHPAAGFVKIEKVFYSPEVIFKRETMELREQRIRSLE